MGSPMTWSGEQVNPRLTQEKRTCPDREIRRIQQSWVAGAEKWALVRLAARTPEWIGPDHLTALGLVAQIGAGICYTLAGSNKYALLGVIACLALNWLGDSLDGTLARVRNRQRPRYGFYVDHMIDSFCALFIMGGLAASRYIDWRSAMGLLVAFLLLSIESYLASYTLGIFRLSFAKFGPTEIRILLGVANTVLFFLPAGRIAGWSHHLLDVGGEIAIVAMTAMALFAAVSHTLALYRQETS